MFEILGRLTLAALSAAPLASQATPSPPASPPALQEPFRATKVIVEVDAVVTDKDGKFVTGLTADDFEVLEDGKPQKIERVYLVQDRTVAASGPAAPARAAAGETSPIEPPPAPAETQRVFVLFFDQEHLQEGAFKRLRDAALAFLTSEFRDGDAGGVVMGSTMVGNRLTSERESLLAAVRNARPTAEKTSRRIELMEWPRLNSEAEAVRIALANDRDVMEQAVRRACQDDPSACRNVDVTPMLMEKARMVVSELRPAARRTVMTLQALATGLSKLPGRKTIILMTEGFFVEESWADLRHIVGAAARSNVRIYSLDARGLDTRQANDLRLMNPMDPGGGMPLEAYNTMADGPNALAVDTGGYAIRGTNDFGRALVDIARDTSEYYVLGYTPANTAADGSFRTIAVRLERPGLKVRARRGYVAATAPAAARPAAPPPLPAGEPRPTAPSAPESTPVEPEPEPAATAPAPEPKRTAAVGTGSATAETGGAPRPLAGGVTLRPDSSNRVNALASREGAAEGSSLASRGWDRYQKGDLEGAAELLDQAARDPNARPWVHYALGYARLGLRQPEQAVREWERVRSAAPEFQPVYLDLADAHAAMQDYTRALEILRLAQTRWPADEEVLNAIGTIQVRRGALDEAIDTFRKAIAAKPRDALAYFNLGRTYHLRYFKTRRYSQVESRWIANAEDARNAIASYKKYVELGGPYEAQAREAIQNLEWVK